MRLRSLQHLNGAPSTEGVRGWGCDTLNCSCITVSNAGRRSIRWNGTELTRSCARIRLGKPLKPKLICVNTVSGSNKHFIVRHIFPDSVGIVKPKHNLLLYHLFFNGNERWWSQRLSLYPPSYQIKATKQHRSISIVPTNKFAERRKAPRVIS